MTARGDQSRRAMGAYGENLVAKWYESNGYEIAARNWRCGAGEIDIVAVTPQVLVVCEVKTRSSSAFGLPVEAITPQKAARLRRLAILFLEAHSFRRDEIRFDVGSVQGSRVEVIQGVF